MDKQGKTAMGMIFALSAMMLLLIGGVFATTMNNDVDIPGSCTADLGSASLSFGSVTAGTTSGEQTTTVTNGGSTSANYTISGTNWIENSNGDLQMATAQTKYAIVTGTYASKTALTNSSVDYILELPNGATNTTYLQMAVPSGQAMGTFNQTVTILAVC